MSVHICEGLARVSVLYGALPIVCIIPIPPLFAQVFFAERDSLLVEGILNARICQNINIALCHCYLLYDTPAIASYSSLLIVVEYKPTCVSLAWLSMPV